MSNVKTPVKKYQDYLIDSLRDPENASAYLTAILEEPNPEPELFLEALRDVAMAIGTPAVQAEAQAFADGLEVPISTLAKYLNGLGLQVVITPIHTNASIS
jgi:DNA-binding phage protein